MGTNATRVSLVIPFYNPGAALRDTVVRSARTLEACGLPFEIVAVSDGSTDGSPATLEGLLPGVLQTVCLPENQGKGEAVRVGFGLATGEYVGFIDADGDIPPELLTHFVEALRGGEVDIAVGSKLHPGSETSSPALRRAFSSGYQLLTKILFDLPVHDTQTGVKFLRRGVLDAVLPETVERRFAFDIELLVLARQLGFDRVVELPVRIGQRSGSTVSLRTVRHILSDTLAVWWRLRVAHAYQSQPATDRSSTVRPAGSPTGPRARDARDRRRSRPRARPGRHPAGHVRT